jgi:hypothetical protein
MRGSGYIGITKQAQYLASQQQRDGFGHLFQKEKPK